jgi:hypothetical protein
MPTPIVPVIEVITRDLRVMVSANNPGKKKEAAVSGLFFYPKSIAEKLFLSK